VNDTLTYKLDVFEGPLDLLLHLIAQSKIRICDIVIADLLPQYLAQMEAMQEQQMEIASEFLEMAARLVHIKTVSLLPKSEEAEKMKQELTGQLLEYQECKRLAKLLAEQIAFDRFVRAPAEIENDPVYERTHTVEQLMKAYLMAAGRAGRRLPPPAESFHELVNRPVVSVSSGVYHVLRALRRQHHSMDAVFATAESRSQLVAIFLALLELIRSERVTVDDDGGLQLREGRLPEPGEEKQDADS
jgi:segregation and condensation protein A